MEAFPVKWTKWNKIGTKRGMTFDECVTWVVQLQLTDEQMELEGERVCSTLIET